MATLFSPRSQQRLFRDDGPGMPLVHHPLAATPSRLPVMVCRRRVSHAAGMRAQLDVLHGGEGDDQQIKQRQSEIARREGRHSRAVKLIGREQCSQHDQSRIGPIVNPLYGLPTAELRC